MPSRRKKPPKRRPQLDKRKRAKRRAIKRAKKRAKQDRRERDRRVTSLYGYAGHRSCGRKARYETREFAERVIEWCVRRGSTESLRAYHCSLCGGWHITHKALRTRTETQDVVVCDSGDATFAQDVV